MKAIIIAAPMSGCGKTTITLGILECLRRRGLKAAPFKVGPDFIDPGYHRLLCARPSINLDGWMCPPDFVRETFAVQAADADIAVIEGVMGLYDGIGGLSEEGSTAQVAKILGAPVLLAVDARSMARSAAAVVKGFADFDAGVRVVGVIFNNVGSENHARVLRETVECAVPGIRMVGCLPRDEGLHIPSRHLGLLTAEENPLSAEFLDHLVEAVKAHMDFGVLWGCAEVHPGEQPPMLEESRPFPGKPVSVAVARDEAFCFVYEDNLRLLREAGAELVEFSPLRDAAFPAGCSGLYLPGGYPEEFADALAANTTMKEAIRGAIEGGMPVYAECGGFIYLTEGIKGHDAFVGVFPVTTRMLPRRKALGYREVELVADSLIGPKGTVARGHEFHYSEMDEMPSHVERVFRVRKHSADLGLEGYRYRNCLASYIHLHFGSNPVLARSFVESCRKFKGM